MLLTNKFFASFDCHNPIAPYCAAVSYVAAVVIAHYFMAVVHLSLMPSTTFLLLCAFVRVVITNATATSEGRKLTSGESAFNP